MLGYSYSTLFCVTVCLMLFHVSIFADSDDNGAATASASGSGSDDTVTDTDVKPKDVDELPLEVPGHMKPLGSHRPPEGSVDSVDGFLDPKTFFDNYVKASKPILFKGAAKGIPAYSLWKDSYLDRTYGSIKVDVETGKKENRSNSLVELELFKFLHIYAKSDVYMVQDVTETMKADLSMLKPLMCGGFQKLLENAVIWFSSGGTKSVLHSDSLYNINCLFDGDKTLVMIDKKYKSLVEADHFVVDGAFSEVDVEAVDMKRFPSLAKVPWWYAKMEKGDCFYIPYLWYHTVASSPPRNLAVNLWFLRPPVFDYDECEKISTPLPDYAPLSSFAFHEGEYAPETKLKTDLYDMFDGADLTVGHLEQAWGDLYDKEELAAIMTELDLNGDKVVTWQEMEQANMGSLFTKYPNLLLNPTEQEQHDEL